jgi:triosephosphate isomerase
MKKLIVGNWKMNGTRAGAEALARAIAAGAGAAKGEIVCCPPFPLLTVVGQALAGSRALLGAQDCHEQEKGAFTGDVSPDLLAEFGVKYVIVGHSERRAQHGETSPLVAKKAASALRAGLIPIICIGETLEIREAGHAESAVCRELEQSLPEMSGQKIVVAYEPIWAIGTGKTCGSAEILSMHQKLRETLAARGLPDTPILYGGSVKAENAAEILALANVDGALVGGASLEAEGFLRIAGNCLSPMGEAVSLSRFGLRETGEGVK